MNDIDKFNDALADEDHEVLEMITKKLWEKHVGVVRLQSGYRVISGEQYNKDIAQAEREARVDRNTQFEGAWGINTLGEVLENLAVADNMGDVTEATEALEKILAQLRKDSDD